MKQISLLKFVGVLGTALMPFMLNAQVQLKGAIYDAAAGPEEPLFGASQ